MLFCGNSLSSDIRSLVLDGAFEGQEHHVLCQIGLQFGFIFALQKRKPFLLIIGMERYWRLRPQRFGLVFDIFKFYF